VLEDFYDDGLTPSTRSFNDLVSFADFDYSGTTDVVARFDGGPTVGHNVLMNLASSPQTIVVSVVGANGEHNQAGRVVRLTPDARPNVIMTQIVDGGSGYMANSPYDITFATPYSGAYTVSVRFANATYTTTAHAGERVVMYANGTVVHQ